MNGETPNSEGDDRRILHEATKRVSVRATHLLMWRSSLAIAVFQIVLAINFFTSTPTFNPLPRHVIGTVFLVVGAAQGVVLTAYHRMRLFRVLTTVSLIVMIGWGACNMPQAIRRDSSFQLPAFCLIVGVLQYFMLREPLINPLTANADMNGAK